MAADITEPVSSVPASDTSSRVLSLVVVPLVAAEGEDLAIASAVGGACDDEPCALRARACTHRHEQFSGGKSAMTSKVRCEVGGGWGGVALWVTLLRRSVAGGSWLYRRGSGIKAT